ncbi:MAG TPA: restriction endonuclease [Puia sp.]|nr:restriction endonuclease [Puia sp.]
MSSSAQNPAQSHALLVDRIYRGGRSGNSADDPLHPLIGVSNQGGFRIIGTKNAPRLVVLTSSQKDPDWPDDIDKENGIYTYYGDNKKPGFDLHKTPRYGNLLLRDMFEKSHGSKTDRIEVPPVLVFSGIGEWRDVRFLGLAVPGGENFNANSDLVAVWRLKEGKRFQNYQAKFTILDVGEVSMKWLNDVKQGHPLSPACPAAWRLWVETGRYRPLKAPRTLEFRKKEEQLPGDEKGLKQIKLIHKHFEAEPFRFEACAAKLAEMMLPNIVSIDLTRPTMDGGRDAIGKFRIGEGPSAILVDFALEAKCYNLSTGVTVKDVSRLISRLRHRQFGILVTTSYLAQQAYQEIKEDEHPIVIISAIDIVYLLKSAGQTREADLLNWLQSF